MLADRTPDHFQLLQKMAECATTAMSALADAVATFAHVLCTYDQSGTTTDEIRAVRDAEESCDRVRNDLVATAFADDAGTHALVYREFALLFDRLVDAMENVVDQVVLISSGESWLVTEAARES